MSSKTVANNIGDAKANPDANRVKVKPSEYQFVARQFARGGGETLVYAILGMMEELSELVGKLRFEKMENSPYHPLLSDVSATLSAIQRDGAYAGRVAKFIRKNWGELSVSTREKLISVTEESGYSKEIGDMAWMLAGICSSLGLQLETVMDDNIRKLEDREKRGVIIGSGDNR